MAKPMKTLELHYPMIHFLIMSIIIYLFVYLFCYISVYFMQRIDGGYLQSIDHDPAVVWEFQKIRDKKLNAAIPVW